MIDLPMPLDITKTRNMYLELLNDLTDKQLRREFERQIEVCHWRADMARIEHQRRETQGIKRPSYAEALPFLRSLAKQAEEFTVWDRLRMETD